MYCQEKKAKIIGTAGNGHRALRQQHEAERDGQTEDNSQAEAGPLAQLTQISACQRSDDEQCYKKGRHGQHNEVARAEAERIMHRQERPKNSKQIHGIRAIPA